MTDVNITYETLYEILRNEKSRDDIQEIPKSFYDDVVEYLKSNKKMYEDAIFSGANEEEKEDIERQIKNIRLLIKEIYERREKKIMNLALNTSRTKSRGNEIDYMLHPERELHDTMTTLFDNQRMGVLARVLQGKLPVLGEASSIVEHQKSNENIMTGGNEESGHENDLEFPNPNLAESKLTPAQKNSLNNSISITEDENQKKTLRFREKVPKFIDKEFEVYGPYEQNEVVNLPSDLAHILIRNGKAEEVVQE